MVMEFKNFLSFSLQAGAGVVAFLHIVYFLPVLAISAQVIIVTQNDVHVHPGISYTLCTYLLLEMGHLFLSIALLYGVTADRPGVAQSWLWSAVLLVTARTVGLAVVAIFLCTTPFLPIGLLLLPVIAAWTAVSVYGILVVRSYLRQRLRGEESGRKSHSYTVQPE